MTDRSCRIACALGLAVAGWVVSLTAQAPQRDGLAQLLRSGDYLRDDYREVLSSTRSPLKALVRGAPQGVSVSVEEGVAELTTMLNFHEGGPEFQLGRTGLLTTRFNAGFGLVGLRFEVLNSEGFKLGFDRFPFERYRFVGDLSRYVAAVVLQGEYVSGDKKHYIFGEDGIAIFPQKRFRYSVGIDQVVNQFDYFEDVDTHEIIGLKRTGDRLDLFRTSGPLSQMISTAPYLSLQKCCAQSR